jgi:hypothetical protein
MPFKALLCRRLVLAGVGFCHGSADRLPAR